MGGVIWNVQPVSYMAAPDIGAGGRGLVESTWAVFACYERNAATDPYFDIWLRPACSMKLIQFGVPTPDYR